MKTLLIVLAVLAIVLAVESVPSGRADHSAPTVTEAATEVGAPQLLALQPVARPPGNLISFGQRSLRVLIAMPPFVAPQLVPWPPITSR